jgi:hypothetical protein
MSRDDSRGTQPHWEPTPPSTSGLSKAETRTRPGSNQLAIHQLEGRSKGDVGLRSQSCRVRRAVAVRGRQYRVSEAEKELLFTLALFRSIAVADLLACLYDSRSRQFGQDLRSLKGQGLIRTHRIMAGREGGVLEVLIPTPEARSLLAALGTENGRQPGPVGRLKLREIAHDAALYRMYAAEAAHISNCGGAVRRVILDYELKASIYARLAPACSGSRVDYAKAQKEVAQTHGLQVTEGRILLPDVRVEYETAEGELRKVDLELATYHYHGAYALAKARVGFKLYADGPSAARLNAHLTRGRAPVPEGPGLTDAILSL